MRRAGNVRFGDCPYVDCPQASVQTKSRFFSSVLRLAALTAFIAAEAAPVRAEPAVPSDAPPRVVSLNPSLTAIALAGMAEASTPYGPQGA